MTEQTNSEQPQRTDEETVEIVMSELHSIAKQIYEKSAYTTKADALSITENKERLIWLSSIQYRVHQINAYLQQKKYEYRVKYFKECMTDEYIKEYGNKTNVNKLIDAKIAKLQEASDMSSALVRSLPLTISVGQSILKSSNLLGA